jgi:hypothetical protein
MQPRTIGRVGIREEYYCSSVVLSFDLFTIHRSQALCIATIHLLPKLPLRLPCKATLAREKNIQLLQMSIRGF